MLLAELVVRHTRRHMPTRRVAVEQAYLPTSGPAPGVTLLAAVLAEHVDALDDEQRDLLPRLLADARRGLRVPQIALRHRLQTDVHGLDRSRHRLVREAAGRVVVELDVHGARAPQVLGVVLAAASLPPTPRAAALRALRGVEAGRYRVPPGLEVRHLLFGVPRPRPWRPGTTWVPGGPPEEEAWQGVPADRRWAMELLGLASHDDVERSVVNRRYRRLVRDAHPDHGGVADHAAERIAELTEARAVLLDLVAAGRSGSEADAADG